MLSKVTFALVITLRKSDDTTFTLTFPNADENKDNIGNYIKTTFFNAVKDVMDVISIESACFKQVELTDLFDE